MGRKKSATKLKATRRRDCKASILQQRRSFNSDEATKPTSQQTEANKPKRYTSTDLRVVDPKKIGNR
jgi:hypothetical protein